MRKHQKKKCQKRGQKSVTPRWARRSTVNGKGNAPWVRRHPEKKNFIVEEMSGNHKRPTNKATMQVIKKSYRTQLPRIEESGGKTFGTLLEWVPIIKARDDERRKSPKTKNPPQGEGPISWGGLVKHRGLDENQTDAGSKISRTNKKKGKEHEQVKKNSGREIN